MAENPAQWGEATKVIDKALQDYIRGVAEGRVGNTGPFQIARSLVDAGFLDMTDIWVDDPEPATPELDAMA